MHGQWRCEHKGRKLLLIINNLHRELVVQGRVSTFMSDNDLLQKLVFGNVVGDCVCSCSTAVGIYSSLKHMQMRRKILINETLCCTLAMLDTSAIVETGCGLVVVACRAFRILNSLEQGLKEAPHSLVLGVFCFGQNRKKSVLVSKRGLLRVRTVNSPVI